MLDRTGRAVRQRPSARRLTLTGPDFRFCHTSREAVALRKSLWHWIREPNPPRLAESRASAHPSAGERGDPPLLAAVTGQTPLESAVTPAGRRAESIQRNATTIWAVLVKRKVAPAVDKREQLAATLENPPGEGWPVPGSSISWRANAFDIRKSGPAPNKLSSGEAELFTPAECECWFRTAGSGLLIHSTIWRRRSCSSPSIDIHATLCRGSSVPRTITRRRRRSYRWPGMRTSMEIRSSLVSRNDQTLLGGFTGCSWANT